MSQIKFYEKNVIDLENSNVTITITDATATNDGQLFVDFMRNRKNTSAWATTGSNDAANTQIYIDTDDSYLIDRIIIVGHNLKAFTIQYWNGAAYTDFSTAVNQTTNSDDTTEFSFTEITTDKIRIIITGTQVADADKSIKQLLVLKSIGQLSGWPQIRKPKTSRNKKKTRLLSGKTHITSQVGFFSCTLSVENWNVAADLAIIESLYFSSEGFLIWINAGDDAQFSRTHIGYRGEDIFLVSPIDEYTPEFDNFYYKTGVKIQMKLEEVVT